MARCGRQTEGFVGLGNVQGAGHDQCSMLLSEGLP